LHESGPVFIDRRVEPVLQQFIRQRQFCLLTSLESKSDANRHQAGLPERDNLEPSRNPIGTVYEKLSFWLEFIIRVEPTETQFSAA
tara:strand:- start:173 stop:430 length:258 start_codon:yes stop_codon:yes gene_type:complete